MGAHGWVVGLASHGSMLLSRSRLVTVESLGLPGHPSSTQLDAVVHIVINQFVTEMLNLPLLFFMSPTLQNILTVK